MAVSDSPWGPMEASDRCPRGFTLSGPYWTTLDPPYVESDGGSDGLGPTVVISVRLLDC